MYQIIAFAHLYKPHIGGLEKYVENFYKTINKKTLIITSQFDNSLPTVDKDDNLDILRIDCIEVIKGKYFIPSIKGIKQISNIIKENLSKELEIHTHTRFYLNNFIASVISNKYEITHYHFEHGSTFVKDGSIIVRIFSYLFDTTLARYILRKSNLVFPISEGVKNFLNTHYKGIKFGPTLYNSYNFKNKDFVKKSKPQVLKLLYVGRLVKSKGIYELIKAARLLKENSLNFKLTLIGDGSEKENIINYVKDNNLTEYIDIKGQLPYNQTQKEYINNDMLLNPSYTEGLPTTVLEALANSLLIVATDVGGTNEIIPKEYLIKDNSIQPEVIYKKVLDIYKNWDKYQNKYINIYKDSKEKFSWERNTQTYINLDK